MQPKTWWIIGIVVLALLALLALLSVISLMITTQELTEPRTLADVLIPFATLIFAVIALILFTVKNKVGRYLTAAYAVYQIILGLFVISNLIILIGTILIGTPLPGESTGAIISQLFDLATIVFTVVSSFFLIAGIVLLLCAWKSKPIFFESTLPKQ